jgi:hypothetical protein
MKTPQKLLFSVGVFLGASACSAPESEVGSSAQALSWTTPAGVYTCLAEANTSGSYQLRDCAFETASGSGRGFGDGSGEGSGEGFADASGSDGFGSTSARGSGSGGDPGSGSGSF